MHVTTRGRYAIRAVLRLATIENGTPVPIQQLASAEEVSPAYLEQLFVCLSDAQLVNSTRGPQGGFLLGRDPTEISIKNVLDAVGEAVTLTPCTADRSDCPCDRAVTCGALGMWSEASEHIRAYLSQLTLAKVLHDGGFPVGRERAAQRQAP